ncbi:MAG: c-type cytochrome, partial [Prosthecobacter sp.]|nr:c-type cytochrome [Prosthecobacter sp.]
ESRIAHQAGKLPGVSGTNGLLPREPTYPAMHWEQQAYVQIDQVGSYTAAAGCAIYEGGAWPAKWNYGYFTTEPTLNIVSHFMVEPDGVTYKAKREPGREQTEFIRSKNLWFRPIEVRVGPDGALYVVDFCNQAIIHNDTRGPTHGPANAAVRPDRDHYYGRIWKVQHKEAKKVEVVKLTRDKEKALEALGESRNAHQDKTALRLYMQDGGEFPADLVQAQGSRALEAYDNVYAVPSAIPDAFLRAKDDWTKSAIIAASAEIPLDVIKTAMESKKAKELTPLVRALAPAIARNPSLLKLAAEANPAADELKVIVLQSIVASVVEPPFMSRTLVESLKKLLGQPTLAAATLPLVTKWDKGGVLAAEVKAQLDKLSATLSDNAAPVEARISAAKGLIAVDGTLGVPALAGKDTPEALQSAIISAMDEQGSVTQLVATFSRLKAGLQTKAFEAILKRPEATGALLDAVKAGSIDRAIFAPGDVARLRSHPNKQIAKRANDLFKVNNAAKDAIIAKLVPEVEKPGNATNGKMLFTAACAVCHKLGDIGVAVGPPLDGMGAHGPAELLIHIVDPNREVDPSFWAFNVTTKKGEVLVGVVTSENNATVTLATQVGLREIAKSDIDKRENTRRSLMPEGLDALGPEPLRDVLAFICGDAMKQFRILHLADAFTADSRDGVFASSKPEGGRVKLSKFGNVQVEGVPFFIQDASKASNGANLIVLKGGPAPNN